MSEELKSEMVELFAKNAPKKLQEIVRQIDFSLIDLPHLDKFFDDDDDDFDDDFDDFDDFDDDGMVLEEFKEATGDPDVSTEQNIGLWLSGIKAANNMLKELGTFNDLKNYGYIQQVSLKQSIKSLLVYKCYFIKQFGLAKEILTEMLEESFSRHHQDSSQLISIKYLFGENINALEIYHLCKDSLTPFGEKHTQAIFDHLQFKLDELQIEKGINLIAEWIEGERIEPSDFFGLPHYEHRAAGKQSSFVKMCEEMIRDAENEYRQSLGVPRIGEGWIAETELYYYLKNFFTELEVVQHGRPAWLGNQHLDVFIPELGVAIEYQGLQHDKPVEFFGGEAAFEKTKERDARKKKLCFDNDIKLIYVREGYDLDKLIKEITSDK